MSSFHALYFLLFVSCTAYQGLITLERHRDFLCITSDIISPTFVVPLAVKKAKIPPSSWAKWSNDDWIGKESSSSLLAPVTDLRWENFAISHANHLSFKNVRSVSFSVYGPGMLKIYFANNTLSFVEEENFQNETQWTHLGLIVANKTVILMTEKVILKKIGISPERIVIKSTQPLFWSIHKYYFKYAENITYGQPSIVTIPPTKKRCLMLYLFLCNTCFLEMMVTYGQNNTKMLSFKNNNTDNNKYDFINQWVMHMIEIDPNSETRIEFYRKNTRSGSGGEWGLDLRTCPDMVDDFAIHRMHGNGRCHSLAKKSTGDFQNAAFTCEPGFLGRNCNITCLSVLGSKYKNCEEHRICQDSSECRCAWGYSEPSCQKVCPYGKWGLSCQNSCDPKCEKCHKQTGNCIYDPPDKNKSEESFIELLMWNPVAETIVIISFIAILVYSVNTLVMYLPTRG